MAEVAAGPYRALLIGNAHFRSEPELEDLLGPANDVRKLKAALTSPEVGLPWKVTERIDATRQEVEDELHAFFEQAAPGEQLLLYYSGHGWLDAYGRLYLCSADTTLGMLRARAVRHSYVNELMEECPARAVVVILDCCFSGRAASGKGADAAALFAGRGRFVLTSCGQRETAKDATEEGEPSPFTAHLVAALQHAAVDGEGNVTMEAVRQYVEAQLRGSGRRPQYKAEGQSGRVALAHRPVPIDRPTDVSRPLDVRPLFTDAQGVSDRPRIETHFTGVVHVLLPESLGTLTVHRDELVTALCADEPTAWWFARRGLRIRRRRARLTGTATAAGGGLFLLPDGAGTLSWSADQLIALNQARAIGSWPVTPRPTQHYGTRVALAGVDPVYRWIASKTWKLPAYTLVWAAALTVLVELAAGAANSAVPVAVRTTAIIVLASFILVSGLVVAVSAKLFLLAIRLRRHLQLPLPVHRMLMKNQQVLERAALWSEEEFQLAMPTRFFSPLVHGCAAPFAPEAPVPVEVIGVPAPGEWAVIRTPLGILWPTGRVKDYDLSLTELTDGHSRRSPNPVMLHRTNTPAVSNSPL
ncbi:caspase family protein [Streptomyces sp. NPDC002685]|uniref:caspase family protein n=1 Tax=Streptomyces sp. NPDC002685 TaxID=3154540 RepID=UPI003329681C